MKNSNKKQAETKKVDYSKLTDEQLLNMEIDENNIYDILEQNESLKPKLKTKKAKKGGLYKKGVQGENESDKNFRNRIRTKRNTFIENIFAYLKAKNKSEAQKEFNSFLEFYKETYNINDFSVESVANGNSDKATKAKIKMFFNLCKIEKLIK